MNTGFCYDRKKLSLVLNKPNTNMEAYLTAVAYRVVDKPAFQKIVGAVLLVGSYLVALDQAVAYIESL